MALYFLATVLSALQANEPEAALFYPWQLARMFLVYAAVARGCADPRVAPALLKGMALGILLEAAVVVWQRFGLDMLQTPGTFVHQNLLGLISHLVVFPFFALLMAGRRGWLPPAVLLAGAVIQVLTTSRGTIGLAGFGYAAVFTLSAMRQWTSRKALVLVIGAAIVAVLTPLAMSSFEHRFAAEGPSTGGEYDEREAYKRVAAMMLSDHPLGIGANHYSAVSNGARYNDRAGVAQTDSSRAGNVHNIYWLTAAETGYPGLITLVFLLGSTLIVAFRCGWRYRGEERADLLLGLGVALLTVYIH